MTSSKGRRFDREIIVLCVRWYLRFKLSFRDLVEMMAERGIYLAHTTIALDSTLCPRIRKALEPLRMPSRQLLARRRDLREDQRPLAVTLSRCRRDGKTVDFLLRAKRDVAAAKAFFRRAFKSQGRLPRAITLDGYQASHRAAREILGEHRR